MCTKAEIKQRGLFKWVVCVGVLVFLSTSGRAGADMRVWHEKNGTMHKGEFERERFGNAFFRTPDKKIVSVPMTNLVPADLRYMYTIIPPTINARARVSSNPIEPSKAADVGDRAPVITGITVVAELTKTSRLPFLGTLSGEIYLIGKEVATDHFRLAFKKGFSVSFPDPNNNLYSFKAFEEFTEYDEYDGTHRGMKYEGYVIAIYGLDGKLMDLKTSLSWVGEEQLALLRKMYVPTWFGKDCKKAAVPRPKSEGRTYLQ